MSAGDCASPQQPQQVPPALPVGPFAPGTLRRVCAAGLLSLPRRPLSLLMSGGCLLVCALSTVLFLGAHQNDLSASSPVRVEQAAVDAWPPQHSPRTAAATTPAPDVSGSSAVASVLPPNASQQPAASTSQQQRSRSASVTSMASSVQQDPVPAPPVAPLAAVATSTIEQRQGAYAFKRTRQHRFWDNGFRALADVIELLFAVLALVPCQARRTQQRRRRRWYWARRRQWRPLHSKILCSLLFLRRSSRPR
jgi:hypothetical protein